MRRYDKRSRKYRLIPIDSTKNLVQFNIQCPTVSVVGIELARGVSPSAIDESDITKTNFVEDGSMIKGINISLRTFNESGVTDSNSTVMAIRKFETQGSVPAALPTLAQMNTLGAQPFKNRVFHVEQAITGSQASGIPMGFSSLKIPKRFHTMKLNDSWWLWLANNTGNNIRMCGLAMYKWYK